MGLYDFEVQNGAPPAPGGPPVPNNAGQQGYNSNGQFGYSNNMSNTGVGIDPSQANTGVGSQNAPMGWGMFWNTFQDPNRQQNVDAIGGMLNHGLQGFGEGGNTSSLAGLTSLAPVQNARAATIDTGQSQNLMGGQVANINALNAQAQGQGPSVAAEVAKQQAEQNTRSQMAALGSQRGAANSALGIRAAQDNAASNQQNAAQNAALGRAQEAMAARQQLGGALSGATQQAQQGAQAQAGLSQQAGMQNASQANQMAMQQGQLDQQTQLANMQARLQAGQIDMGQYNAFVQALMTQNSNDWGAQMTAEQAMAQNALAAEGMHYQGTPVSQEGLGYGLAGAGIAALGAGTAAALTPKGSDKYLKTLIRSGERDVKGFMEQIGPAASRFALMESI